MESWSTWDWEKKMKDLNLTELLVFIIRNNWCKISANNVCLWKKSYRQFLNIQCHEISFEQISDFSLANFWLFNIKESQCSFLKNFEIILKFNKYVFLMKFTIYYFFLLLFYYYFFLVLCLMSLILQHRF